VFLFWRGRVLLYNGQTDLAKKHIKQALQIDPDNTKVMRFWKSLNQAENLKNSANSAFKDNMLEVACGLFTQCL
jgi:Tfp pilus assembly protein PilF